MFSLCLLHFEGCGSLDLAEIYQFSLSKRCAFDFRHLTFAYPPPNHTAGAPAVRTWILVLLDILCVFAVFAPLRRMRIARSRRDLSIQPLETLRLGFRHPTFAYPRARHTPGAPALRTCILGLLDLLRLFALFTSSAPLRKRRIARSSQNSPPTLRREILKPNQRTAFPRGGFSPRGLYFFNRVSLFRTCARVH